MNELKILAALARLELEVQELRDVLKGSQENDTPFSFALSRQIVNDAVDRLIGTTTDMWVSKDFRTETLVELQRRARHELIVTIEAVAVRGLE